MRRSLLVITAIIFAGLIATVSCRISRQPPTYFETTQTIEVGINEEFVIGVDYEITTEYFWQEIYDHNMLELLESTCILCSVGELESLSVAFPNQELDSDAYNYSRFKALSKGETEVIMNLKKPQEDEYVEQRIFKIVVK